MLYWVIFVAIFNQLFLKRLDTALFYYP